MRGVAEADIPRLVERLFAQLGLTRFADTKVSRGTGPWHSMQRVHTLVVFSPVHSLTALSVFPHRSVRLERARQAGALSGGNRRKLSLAIALVGDPPVLLLDEPSTGMDPEARRFMWDAIIALRSRHAIVLTTHSMEEADALSTHISIMVDGVMRCYGTPQRIKSRYSQGYHLSMRAPKQKQAAADSSAETDANNAIIARVTATFPGAHLEESYGAALSFKVPPSSSISRIFAGALPLAEELGASDFVVAQDTLEQIFLQFAAQQDEAGSMHASASVATIHWTAEAALGNVVMLVTCCYSITLGASMLVVLWCSIIFFPVAKMLSRRALLLMWWGATACGRDLDGATEKAECQYPHLTNALWILFFGIGLACMHVVQSILCCVGVVTIPLASKHYQMALLCLRLPFVPHRTEEGEERSEANSVQIEMSASSGDYSYQDDGGDGLGGR